MGLRAHHGMMASVALVALASGSQALAQETLPPDQEVGQATISDIVVTASRREERLQDVPVSVTALSGDFLAASGVDSTNKLTQVTPGLFYVNNSTAAQFSVRGITARSAYPGDEPNIAMYVDGVYQPSPTANTFDLLEITRIEVLRGPQGTLFGRNSTGGLINVITPDPAFEARGTVEAQYGNFDTIQVRGYFTAPITDNLAFDLSGNYYDDGGYIRDLVNGGRVGERKMRSVRSKLLFEPSDGAKLVLTGSYSESLVASGTIYQPLRGNTVGVRVPGAVIPTRPNSVALNVLPPDSPVKQKQVSLQTTFDLGAVGLETTTSYQQTKTNFFFDNDASTLDAQRLDISMKDDILMQEIRLISNGSGAFKWTAGVFGYHSINHYSPLAVSSGGVRVFSQQARNKTMSVAAYAEGTLAVSDAFNVTVGGRYSWEKRRYTYRTRSGSAIITSPAGGLEETYNLFTPRVSLQYVFSPNFNVYGSYSKGAKSGLFNTSGPTNEPVAPEKLDAFELGFKSDPAGWLRVNASAFYYKYKDIQLTQRDPIGISRLANAGKATNYGAELELTIKPTNDLDLRLGAAYLHTNIDEYLNAVTTVPNPPSLGGNTNVIVADLKGRELVRSPKFTFNFGGDWSREVGFGKVGVGGNLFYSSRFFFDYANRVSQGDYVLVNGQVWVEPKEGFRVSLYGENLTNTKNLQNVLDANSGDLASYSRPRSYGVRARVQF